MSIKRSVPPIALYFYEGNITQDEIVEILSKFNDYNVKLRKVHDRNNLQDMLERCDYVSGAVPLIYSARKAEGVMTKGVLEDPLGRKNSMKAVKQEMREVANDVIAEMSAAFKAGNLSDGQHVAPVDAAIAEDKADTAAESVTTTTDEVASKDKKAVPVAPVAPAKVK